jgi:hypothetical protein
MQRGVTNMRAHGPLAIGPIAHEGIVPRREAVARESES